MKIMEIILGSLTFFSFFLAVMLTALTKRFVDPDKVRQHPDIQRLFTTMLLPREMLTPLGQRLWLWRNVLAVITIACVVVIVIWQQILK